MGLSRRLAAIVGVVALSAVGGCGSGGPFTSSVAGKAAAEPQPVESQPAEPAGFDECSLLTPKEVAGTLGVPAMHITLRETLTQDDGTRLAACAYATENTPGVAGMVVNVVADTDAERFFAPFKKYKNVRDVAKLGDQAKVIGYEAKELKAHYREIRVLSGHTGLHLWYSYSDAPGGMPEADGEKVALLLTAAVEKLPEQVTITSRAVEGACADVDLAEISEVVGDKLTTSRSVVGTAGAAHCQFSGEQAAVAITVVSEPERVKRMTVAAKDVNAPDVGDGARLSIGASDAGQGPLYATVNLEDKVLKVIAAYGPKVGTVKQPRPQDQQMVKAIAKVVGG